MLESAIAFERGPQEPELRSQHDVVQAVDRIRDLRQRCESELASPVLRVPRLVELSDAVGQVLFFHYERARWGPFTALAIVRESGSLRVRGKEVRYGVELVIGKDEKTVVKQQAVNEARYAEWIRRYLFGARTRRPRQVRMRMADSETHDAW